MTPVGLRTRARGDGYHGRITGDQRARDGAYHEGTVWPFLLGIYADACPRVRGRVPAGLLDGLRAHLRGDGLGQLAEIFDGDPPHQPRGCPAQAWSVAEALRVLTRRYGAWIDAAARDVEAISLKSSTAVKSTAIGEASAAKLAPPSLVWRMVPAAPTAQPCAGRSSPEADRRQIRRRRRRRARSWRRRRPSARRGRRSPTATMRAPSSVIDDAARASPAPSPPRVQVAPPSLERSTRPPSPTTTPCSASAAKRTARQRLGGTPATTREVAAAVGRAHDARRRRRSTRASDRARSPPPYSVVARRRRRARPPSR